MLMTHNNPVIEVRNLVRRYGNDRKAMGTLMFRIDSIAPVGGDGAVVLGFWELRDTPAAGRGGFTLVLLTALCIVLKRRDRDPIHSRHTMPRCPTRRA